MRHVATILVLAALFGCGRVEVAQTQMAMKRDEHKNADCRVVLDDPRLKRVADELRPLLRNGIRILATEATEGIAVGQSKLGGRPDLPVGIAWPTVKIEIPAPSEGFLRSEPDLPRLPPDGIVSLPFIAQINLSDVCDSDLDRALPDSGVLFFFYNPDSYPSDTGSEIGAENLLTGYRYGYYGWDNPGNWRVVYHDGAASVERREFPSTIPDRLRFRPHTIEFRSEMVLPCLLTTHIGDADDVRGRVVLNQSEWNAYADLRYDLRANMNLHQMLGYADQYATTSDEASYLNWRSMVFPGLSTWDTLTDREQSEELRSIRVLLQLEVFDNDADWYGRNGHLFFFIRDADLKHKGFDKVWTAVE